MSRIVKRLMLASVAICLVVSATIGSSMSPAHASGYDFAWSAFGDVVRSEPITVSQGDASCPVGTHSLEIVTVDSESHLFVQQIGTTSANGTWTPRWFYIDPRAAFGSAAVSVRCKSGGITVKSSNANYTWIAPQTSRTVAVKKYASDFITFSSPSTDPCPANASGTLSTYGTPVTPGTNPRNYIDHIAFTANANGAWAATVNLSTKYTDNGDYFAIWECYSNVNWDSSFNSTAYHFKPKYFDYVALGDSYSSGEGSWNYDVPGYGEECHTSSDSYPYYVASATSYGTPNLVACSGAVTDDMWNYSEDLSSDAGQFDQLDFDTELVTLTIGGNDAGFQEVLTACVETPAHSGYNCRLNSSLTNAVSNRMNALDNGTPTTNGGRSIHSITSVLQGIHSRSPNAEIYIGGYPRLFGSNISDYTTNSSAPGGASCTVTAGAVVSYSDAQWMNARANQLNGIISDAVDVVRQSGIDATYVPSNFNGHVLCDYDNLLLNPVILDSVVPFRVARESMHPTSGGMLLGYGLPFELSIN